MFKSKKQNNSGSDSLSKVAWRRFRKDKLAMFGVGVLLICTVVAILGSHIRPDKTEDVQQQISGIDFQPPGFKVHILEQKLNHEADYKSIFDRMFFGGEAKEYKNIAVNPNYYFEDDYIHFTEYNAMGGEPINKMLHIADVLYPLDYNNQYVKIRGEDGEIDSVSFIILNEGRVTKSVADLQAELEADFIFERTYWLGTAKHGRDMLSLIMASVIISLTVGFMSVLIAVTIGISLGAIAGYFRGWIDDFITYIINVIWSIPALLIVMVLSLAMGKGFNTVFVAIGLTTWVDVARLVRGQVLSVREKEFVEASRALGYRSMRIIVRHMLPNIIGPIIVLAAANFAYAILIESGMSYLGIGTQPPQPSLGLLVAEYKNYITNDGQAYLAILPGAMIVLLVLSFTLIGNGVRDALDNRAVESSPSNIDPEAFENVERPNLEPSTGIYPADDKYA